VQLLAALEQTARLRGERPADDLKRLNPLLQSENDALLAGAARLAGLWKQEDARSRLQDLIDDGPQSNDVRQAAMDGLLALGGKTSIDFFSHFVRQGKRPAATRRMAVIALAALDLEEAAKYCDDVLSLSPEGEGAAEVFDAFLQRKNGA